MARKRLTQNKVFETSSLMLNQNSGFDMQYQINKVYNLNLASKTINRVVIEPNETFSFWQLVRWADRDKLYKDGLNLINGQIVGSYGGGLCQLSNMLFWMFLHTPLTVIERHGHAIESFPSTTEDLPCGTDATINEGWLDLKVRNTTNCTFQIAITFDDSYMYGSIRSDCEVEYNYKILNEKITYFKKGKKIYQCASVDCVRIDRNTNCKEQFNLYENICQIGYDLPDGIIAKDKGE